MKKEMKREVEDALEILNGLISNYNDWERHLSVSAIRTTAEEEE